MFSREIDSTGQCVDLDLRSAVPALQEAGKRALKEAVTKQILENVGHKSGGGGEVSARVHLCVRAFILVCVCVYVFIFGHANNVWTVSVA